MPTYEFSVRDNITSVIKTDDLGNQTGLTTSQPAIVNWIGNNGYEIVSVGLAFLHDQITSITINGNPIDPIPEYGNDSAAALQSCFPVVGAVTVAADVNVTNSPLPVSIAGGAPMNIDAIVMDTLAPLPPTGHTLAQNNPMCRGGIITIVTTGATGAPSAVFYLDALNPETLEWERLAAITSAITGNAITKPIVYPGAVDAQYPILPLSWRISWIIGGAGTLDGNIAINYVV